MNSGHVIAILGGLILVGFTTTDALISKKLPCECGGGSIKKVENKTLGYVGMYSFDGNRVLSIADKQETLMAQSSTSDDDVCKFKLTLSTKGNAKLQKSGAGGLYIFMAEFAFGLHSGDPAKYSKNIRLGQNKCFTRGQGFGSGQEAVELPLSYTTPDGANHIDISETGGNETHKFLAVTSQTCDYHLEYHSARDKDNRDGFIFAIGRQYMPTGSGRTKVDHVFGMCGTCDGSQGNDRRVQGGTRTMSMGTDTVKKISASYKKVSNRRKPKRT